MVNRVVLVGRLVKDPELRKTNSDISVATFTIAVDNTIKEQDGTRGTLFLDCRVYRDQADNMAKFTRKGSKVAVDGSLNQRNFTYQDGFTRISVRNQGSNKRFLCRSQSVR